MPDPHLRAADADRSAVAAVLGQHMAAGRLTLEEYDERLARAYAAKTYGDLAQLTADLPATPRPPAPRPGPAPAPAAPGSCAPALRHGVDWRTWLSTAAIVTTIWLITSIASGSLLYFWPIWVIGPWGAWLLVQRLTGGDRRDDGGPRALDA